jgi:transposase-like protein
MHKVRDAMKSSESYPIEGDVEVDEFVVGGHESGKVGRSYHTKKKKAVCAVEFSNTGNVKRMYVRKVDGYSAADLREIFDRHISTEATVKTDKWRGYAPLKEDY